MKSKKWALNLFPLIILLVIFSGCSSAGYWNQSGRVSETTNYGEYAGTQFENIRPGARVELTFKDSSSFIGQFDGMEQMDPNVYRRLYLQYLHETKSEMALPKPGDEIYIKTNSGLNIEARFIGFDYKRVGYVSATDSLVQWVSDNDIDRIGFDGNMILDGATIGRLTTGGNIPMMSALVVEDKYFRNLIAIHSIDRIDISAK